MRAQPTEAERRLWLLLRSRRLAEFKFRRQVPIGRYIGDILCPDHKLIVELDGSQHAGNELDIARDRWLTAQGFRILRIWNNDMLARPSAVLETIWAHLQEQEL
jgi:very-short-patch-repair endonuclease